MRLKEFGEVQKLLRKGVWKLTDEEYNILKTEVESLSTIGYVNKAIEMGGGGSGGGVISVNNKTGNVTLMAADIKLNNANTIEQQFNLHETKLSTVDTNFANVYTKAETDTAIQTLIAGFLSEDEITALITDLNTALTKNAGELSVGERNTVIEMVQNAITDAQETSGNVTADQVQTMINTALNALETPLTEEQVRAIINESVASMPNIESIPDYANMQSILMADNFAPYGPEGTKGTPYIMQNDGFIIISGRYALSISGSLPNPAWWANQYLVNNKVVGRSYIYFTQTGEIPFYFTSSLIPISTGDEITLSGDASKSDFNVSAVSPSSINIYYYPLRNGSINASQNDLGNFATILAMSNGDAENADTIDTHKLTDRFRWQDAYNGEKESIIRDAANAGLIPDNVNIVQIDNPIQEFSVNDEAGGVIGVTMRNVNGEHCTVIISGTQSVTYSSDGLTDNIPITKYFWLHVGDAINSINVEKYEYTPFKTDTNSAIYLLWSQLEQTQLEMSNLKARMENKILDTANTVDIESSQPYTVTNELGGRVHYTGLNVLITTWALYVNDKAVRNGALLGLGTTQGDYDVNNGDIIDSVGMTALTFTPYILGLSTQSAEVKTLMSVNYSNITPYTEYGAGWVADNDGYLVVPPGDGGSVFLNGIEITERGNIPIKKGDLIKSYYKPLLQFTLNQ